MSETCWAVIEMTSASNGFGWIGGRKPGSAATTRARVGSPAAQAVKTSRSNGAPSRSRTSASIVRVVRAHVDPARRSFDPHLASGHDAVQAAVVPERGAVHAEDMEARRREREVVGLRQRDEHARTLAGAPAATEMRSPPCAERPTF